MPKYPSTLLPQTSDPTESQKAALDLLDKINKSDADLTASVAETDANLLSISERVSALESNPEIIEGAGYFIKKWSDGTIEQWVTVNLNAAPNNASGNIFNTGAVALGNWPMPFVSLRWSIIYLSTSSTSTSWIVTLASNAPDETSMGNTNIADSQSSGSTPYTINIYGMGKWK